MRHLALLALLVVSGGACAACNSPLLAKLAPPLSTATRPYYIRVAEAMTSATMGEPMRVAPRMFSAYQNEEACRLPRRIERLEAPTRTIALQLGDRLTLSTLRIVAVSDGNVAVPNVPIIIEAEELSPSVIELRTGDLDLAEGRVRTVGSGTFHLRIRTLCSATNAGITITGVVTP